jgi:methylated-DNA-[protein]-cysteine S-methyltransferase
VQLVGYLRFETALGTCAVEWSDAGVTRTWLPGRLPARPDDDPPQWVADAVSGMQSLLDGGDADLVSVPLDLDGVPDFDRRVYDLVRRLPRGTTVTYGEVAQRLGSPRGAQAVGQAMGHNRVPIVVPCHRVVAAGGRNGGFSAPGGVDTKLRMLAIEGAALF